MAKDPSENGCTFRPPSPKDTSTVHSVVASFCESTSIRGLRRAVTAEHRFIRMFWTFFVIIGAVGVVYIGTFCIKAYTRYQTVTRRHKRPFVSEDFPTVTLCTDSFFGDTEDTRKLVRHPKMYQHYVDKLFEQASREKRFDELAHLRMLRTTVMYNINNMAVWSNLSQSILDSRQQNYQNTLRRNHTNIFCSLLTHGSYVECNVEVFFDLRYRNCLSMKVRAFSLRRNIIYVCIHV